MMNNLVQVAFVAVAFSIGFELLAALFASKLIRLSGYAGTFLLSGFAGTLLFVVEPGIPTFIVLVVAIYRVLNAARAIAGRMHEARLFRVTSLTSYNLMLYQVTTLAVWALSDLFNLSNVDWLWGLLLVAAVGAIIINFSISRNLKKSALRGTDKYRSDIDLPTVSVCIPARNETSDLPACLSAVLANNYPKLEVLVLDDCSQDKTSEIIKGFAHSGVRFIKGEKPHAGWLAKNQAYQQLAEAASGEVILFCGVDVILGKRAIWSMVDCLTSRDKKMLSILPKGMQTREHAGLVQPMRYWWELAWPRRLFNRPPVLSTCWMIARDALQSFGNFEAVSNTVIPEGYFARELTKNDTYGFLRSSKSLEVASTKQLSEQWATAVRTRYPELRKRPESVMLVSLVEAWVLLLPLIVFITGFIISLGIIWVLAGLVSLLLGFAHYRIIRAWQVDAVSLPLALMPVAVGIELFLLNYSLYRYEFKEVVWKERNICIPVMRAIPHLPKI